MNATEKQHVEQIINETFTGNDNVADVVEIVDEKVERSMVEIKAVEETSLVIKEEETTPTAEEVHSPQLPVKSQKAPDHLRPFYFNKFPGSLHLIIEDICKMRFKSDFFTIRVEFPVNKKNTHVESIEYNTVARNTDANISFHIKIPVEDKLTDKLIIKIYICDARNKDKLAVTDFIIDQSMLNSIHNRLGETKKRFNKYYSPTQYIGSFFKTNIKPIALSCKIYCSYLSTDELPTIQSIEPFNLYTLSKWLTYRKYAFDLLFTGFINIKGDLNDSTQFLWKHRYVKWYGYTLYLFNDKTKKLVSSINVSDSLVDTTSLLNKGNMSFETRAYKVEIHTECDGSREKLLKLINTLFTSSNKK